MRARIAVTPARSEQRLVVADRQALPAKENVSLIILAQIGLSTGKNTVLLKHVVVLTRNEIKL